MSDLPRMLSKREIELEELEVVKEVQSLREENQKLQEQFNTAKKAFEYIINSDDIAFGFVNSNLRRYIEKTLAALEAGEGFYD